MNGITNLPLTIFIIFLIVYAVNSLFVIYHLLRFGLDYKTKLLAIIFSVGSILLITVNLRLFSGIEWPGIFKYLNIQTF